MHSMMLHASKEIGEHTGDVDSAPVSLAFCPSTSHVNGHAYVTDTGGHAQIGMLW